MRKRRTREHIIADLSVNYVERFLLLAGHTVEITRKDYGYDMTVLTFDEQGQPENGSIFIQVKATDGPKVIRAGDAFVFQTDMRDIDLWLDEPMPVLFVLYDAKKEEAYWLYVQDYFFGTSREQLRKTATVRIPKHHVVNQRAIQEWIGFKNYMLKQLKELRRREQ